LRCRLQRPEQSGSLKKRIRRDSLNTILPSCVRLHLANDGKKAKRCLDQQIPRKHRKLRVYSIKGHVTLHSAIF